MANNITVFKKYIDKLDEVYALASTSAVLDTADGMNTKLSGTGELVIPKMTLDGLADHSRNGNYVDGNVTITYETKAPDFDRDRSFTVDSMDNEETEGVAFGMLSSTFIRTKVVPELDAYRYAKYSGYAGTKVSADITSSADLMSALSTAITTMKEAEVDAGSTYLFITPTLRQLIADMDSYKSKEVLNNFAGIVEVPSSRFSTAITQNDGKSSGQESGGFVASGKAINFLIISKPAVIQVSKHVVSKIITPEQNQMSDGWKFMYRAYGIAESYDNKSKGIYCHNATK